MGRISLASFSKEGKKIIKANAEVLQGRIEKELPLEASEKEIKSLAKEVAFRAFLKYEEGYISHEELVGKQKLIYVRMVGSKYRDFKDQQIIVVEYNDNVAMYYSMDEGCVGNTQAVTDWSDEPGLLEFITV